MYLGIDLGTSNSAVSGNIDGNVRIFKTTDGADVLPSVIYIDKRGHRLYGKRAYDQSILSPDNVAKGFKRLMGSSSLIEFKASGLVMTPEECSAEILRQLVGQAVTEAGSDVIKGTAITIPAAFNQMQSEATLRAANAAGLDHVALVQEPVAAAMAAMAQTKNRSGQFLVYDLGGGTFDLALVQALSGTINIIGHEGINMLGGQDFDRTLVNNVIRPWLVENFSLPGDFQKIDRYRRLLGKAQIAAELAKIDLSANERATIFRSDEDIQVQDEDGNDIYLDVEITRSELEALVEDRVADTIELTRKIIKDNGYSSQDIDRIVFIGGPSKMPWIRDRVPRELGIASDVSVDPMTAVSVGAAIYAESREWGKSTTSRKATRASTNVQGGLGLKFDYPTRTTDERIKIRVKADPDAIAGRYVLQFDTAEGWTSGRVPVAHDLTVDVPVPNQGENKIAVAVFDDSGKPVSGAMSELMVTRTYATAAAIPATQTISVKIRAGATRLRNLLEPIIRKGTPLPVSGSTKLQAAYAISANLPGHIDLELFQDEGAANPDLNLAIGVFRVKHTDLSEDQMIREGDPVIFHWTMDDSGLLSGNVELPSVQQTFSTKRFYVDQAGHQSFEGEAGEQLVESLIKTAESEVVEVAEAVGVGAETEVGAVEDKIEEQRALLRESTTSDERRSITETVRHLRQSIARVRSREEFRGRLLEQRLDDLVDRFNRWVKPTAPEAQIKRFQEMAVAAANEIRRRIEAGFDHAEAILDEMSRTYYVLLWKQDDYVVETFRGLAGERYLSPDKQAFDLLMSDGESAIKANDIDELRQIVLRIWATQLQTGRVNSNLSQLASVLRG